MLSPGASLTQLSAQPASRARVDRVARRRAERATLFRGSLGHHPSPGLPANLWVFLAFRIASSASSPMRRAAVAIRLDAMEWTRRCGRSRSPDTKMTVPRKESRWRRGATSETALCVAREDCFSRAAGGPVESRALPEHRAPVILASDVRRKAGQK